MDDDGRISPRHAAEVAAFFDEHAISLFGYACVLTHGDRERAMDLRQEAFVAAARAWGATVHGLPPEMQKKWLRTTLQNIEKNDYRRRETERRELALLVPLYRPGTDTPDGERAAAFEQAAEIVKALPGQQDKIARMRWGAGMKAREIADELGIAEGTVHATLSAVRKKLAGPLERYRRTSEGGQGEAS